MKRSIFFTYILFLFTFISMFLFTSCITKRDQSPPTTTIVHPPSGAVLNGVVQVVVTASDERDVETTKLFIDGVEVSSVSGDELIYEWDTAPMADNLSHHISAYAIDDSKNIGPSSVHVVQLSPFIGTAPQSVTIQNPLNGLTVSGTVNVAVGVAGQTGNTVDSVVVFIDGARFARLTQPPYIVEWNTETLPDRSQHTIFAIAFDQAGFNVTTGVTTVTVISDIPGNLTPPIAIIDNPINGQTVSGEVNIVTRVLNLDHNAVDSVVFVVDGFRLGRSTTAPYIFPWDVSSLPNSSSHTIFTVVYDQLGFNISSNVTRVTVQSDVDDNDPEPVVTIIFPNPDVSNIISKSAVGNSITIVADATDNSGVITKVEFFIDGILQAEDATPLYQYTWDLTNVVSGLDHTIYIRAFDGAGNIGAALLGVRIED